MYIIDDQKLKLLKEKFNNRIKKVQSPGYLDDIHIQNELNKKVALEYIDILRSLANEVNLLAIETIDYWNNTWKGKIHNDFSYNSVKLTMKETLDAIYNKLYE